MNEELVGKTVDVTPLFQAAHIATPQISIIETVGMYPYKEKIVDNWAYYTAVGLKHFREILDAEHRVVNDIGIVGICSGVEGIAVVQIFKDTLQKLIVTDIDDEILSGTVINIGNSAKGTEIKVLPAVGSFCEPIEQAGVKVDFVHANIPNLPSTGEEDLTKGAEKGTFLPSSLYEGYAPPEKFVGWALGAQFAYLTSAKHVLKPEGSIITELGGRVPISVVEELFEACGLKMSEVIVGFKEQTEALIDFIGYHRMETNYGVSFEFYRFEEGKDALAKHGVTEPTWSMTGVEIKKIIEPYKVSAGEALDLYHQGVAVGHTVHLFRGTP